MINRVNCCFSLTSALVFLFATLILVPIADSSEETYKFVRMWPTLQQPWYFSAIYGGAVDSSGYIYVPDYYNHCVKKFTSSGQFVARWGSYGGSDGSFIFPIDIAIDPEGYVYVADISRVQKFTSNGKFVSKWNIENGLYGINSITVDNAGNVYVAGSAYDQDSNQIQKFTSQGLLMTQWGGQGTADGQFQSPFGIAVDNNGFVYVADLTNHRIQKFTSNGQFVTKWDCITPRGIDIDKDGHILVLGNYILTFTPNGQLVTTWDVDYSEIGPSGIFTDVNGNVYLGGSSGVYKFTPTMKPITQWASKGKSDGMFWTPRDIAISNSGYVFVTDSDNNRIQKFSSDGTFLLDWGGYGRNYGEFYWPLGVATDSDGNVYVTDANNSRVQKFTSKGEFITAWGESGSAQGQFTFHPANGGYPSAGIAIDGNGYIYVADSGNHRVQKFDFDGKFLSAWGSAGNGDGEFNESRGPTGITIDNAGNILVVDEVRVQKFTSDGQFLVGWAVHEAQGIATDAVGNIFVIERLPAQIKKFSSDGTFLYKFSCSGTQPGQMSFPRGITLNRAGSIFVADTENNRIQIFEPVNIDSNNKAIIVAGGGPFSGNNLWDATQMCTNFAYRTLTYQGFTKESIYYLTSDTDLDLDNNGVADDVDGDATNANLQTAITTWAKDADSLVLYIADHGGTGTFRMSGTETLSVSDLDSWLDTLQETIPGKVAVIYDACESGSFLSSLTSPSGKERVVITSTSPGESAKFVTQGSISFSNYFWTHIFNGVNVKDSLVLAKNALAASFSDQTPLLDANGNGTANEAEDYTLTQNTYIGNGTVISGDAPEIGSVSPDQTLNGASTASLYAASVTDDNGVARVWAVIRSPDYNQGSSDNPVTSLPSVDLMPVGGDRYEGAYSGFNIAGTYQVVIYARDRIGNTSIPKLTTVSVNNPLRRRAIIVAGGPQSDPLWPAIQKNAGLAYDALAFQGYTKDDIYFMSPVTFSAGVDGLPTLSNIEDALTRWAKTSTQDVVLYLVGNGGNGTFKVNETENLSGSNLDTWLDSLQTAITGKVTVIYDACRSGSFLPLLTPPSGKERILIATTSASESAYFLSGGDISFSKYFWSQVANGSNVRNAFLHGKKAIIFSCRGQTPQMDDNGNGTGNEKADGLLARNYTIGAGIMLAGDDPIIGSVCPAQTLAGDESATLWANDVTSTNTISKVWAIITPPGYSSDPSNPVTDLPTVVLNYVGGNRYEGTYESFSSTGSYEIAVYAMDQDGNVSIQKETTVTQSE